MSYIGRKPTVGNFQICDAISVVNGQAAYTMQVGSVNVIPQSANHMIVSLNGTIQKPNSSFTVSGSTITFSSNLATGDVIDFIQILGDVLDLGVPSDATVTSAKLTTLTSAVNFEGEPSNMKINFNNTGSASHATPLGGIMVKNNGDSVGQITIRKDTSDTDGYINFETQSSGGSLTERVRIHSNGVMSAANGIALGVGTANTASNVLDDYEEGSFTTTLNSGLGASLNDWNYTKIGNFVILSGKVTISSSDASGTQVTMSLPFNSSGRNAVTVNFVSGQNTGTIGLSAYSNNSSTMQFYGVQDNANEFNHTNADVSSGDEYYITFTYRSA